MENSLDVKDEIDERLVKIKALISCLLSTNDSELELNRKEIYNIIWIIDDLIKEIFIYKKKEPRLN